MTLITALCIQIGTNFANDYYDCLKGADTSTRIGPRRMTQAGLISLSKMKLATFLTFSCVALLSFYLTARGGPVFTLLTTLSIACGILYTGGPKPLAYLGLGELFVLFFFGPIATAGAAYLQTLTFSWEAVVLGFTPGLLSTAVLVINNLRDIENDRRAGKKTLAVRYGKRFTQYEYTILIALGCLLPLAYGWWLSAFALIPALIPLKAVWRHAPGFRLPSGIWTNSADRPVNCSADRVRTHRLCSLISDHSSSGTDTCLRKKECCSKKTDASAKYRRFPDAALKLSMRPSNN